MPTDHSDNFQVNHGVKFESGLNHVVNELWRFGYPAVAFGSQTALSNVFDPPQQEGLIWWASNPGAGFGYGGSLVSRRLTRILELFSQPVAVLIYGGLSGW
jgi:hypothetical protein